MGIWNKHAEVFLVDCSPVVFGGLVHLYPTFRSHLWSAERWKPAVAESAAAFELNIGPATEPDVHWGLVGFRLQFDAVVLETLALMSDWSVFPELFQQWEGFVEDLGSFPAFNPEELLLDWIGDAESERRQQPTARQSIEAGKFFGQHGWIAPRQHQHRHPKLEFAGPTRRVREPNDGVGALAAEALAQPDAVELERLECVDERIEGVPVVGETTRSEAVANSNLHVVEARAQR